MCFSANIRPGRLPGRLPEASQTAMAGAGKVSVAGAFFRCSHDRKCASKQAQNCYKIDTNFKL